MNEVKLKLVKPIRIEFKPLKLRLRDSFKIRLQNKFTPNRAEKEFKKRTAEGKISAYTLASFLSAKLGVNPKDVKIPDRQFTLATDEEIERFLQNCHVKDLKYVVDIFDCDNFALELCSAVNISFKANRRENIVFGEIWAKIKDEHGKILKHAFNFYINPDLQIKFIEPQTCKIAKYQLLETYFVRVV